MNLYTEFIGGDGSMDALLKHFDHFLSLGGEGHIGLGCDFDGSITPAGGMDGVQDMRLLAAAMLSRGYGKKLVCDIFYNNMARFLGLPEMIFP